MFTSVIRFGLATLLLLPQIQAVAFPPPTGPYGTSLTIIQLTDITRPDPFAPNNQSRSLMVSIFLPVISCTCSPITVPYMDATTAAFQDAKFSIYGLPSDTFTSLELQVCKASKSRIQNSPGYPVVIFSPGFGTSRLLYNAIAQQVASLGYAVVTVDHPYDVDIVTYPDNSTVQGLDFPNEQIPFVVDTRVRDFSFVLNRLARPSVTKRLFGGSHSLLDLSKAAIFGHSLGGAAAAEAMLFDPRLQGGINLDGTFFGTVVSSGLRSPFLIFGHEGKDTSTDPSWEAIWPKLTGWKRELMLNGTQHYAFSDLINIIDVLGITESLSTEVTQLLGSIKGARAIAVVTEYVSQFFDMVLKSKSGTLFDGPDGEFPEVTFGNP